ncbi:MAG: NTF2-like N-terminal transpeptidase domain-containing protein, partial [Dehalococcoidia bacterium]|nr:NTF2-like N-terminal transpeptidase domain-containing protein [Dehalococcoidia bacterium]
MRWLTSRLPATLLTVALVAAFACTSGKGSSGDKKPDPPKTPLETAQRFFGLWQEKEYGDMYDLISAEARATISKEDFVKRYNAIAEEATITGIDYEPGPNVV